MTSDTWPPSDSDTSWSPLSRDSPPLSPSPLPSLALDDMEPSALPSSQSGALSLPSIDAQVHAWRMPPVELRRRETVRAKASPAPPPPPVTDAAQQTEHEPTPAAPPTPWDVVQRTRETTRALGSVPGTLFALLVLPHLVAFALLCAAGGAARRAVGAAWPASPRPLLLAALVLVLLLTAVYFAHATLSRMAADAARHARLMGEIRRELAVLRAQIREANRECAGAARFVGKTVREQCRMAAERGGG
ncbi:hypothetical protein CC85DRAFT_325318 [Cutaneotrichosporon oleaginosum]|uniref:Uncharacterized protein n=1 Tax=Cutaneotrichosporon oleaginosum TaxID=879819 RepID=A0A0J0XWY6_9TREE|nr:uncharacterized protein CC85DRAFT_325318 [Cutaneotrichosporon oleaginosum]KLT45580.1 hypothetical protein CC85DRAFT_325318 [Cutaneotrichosporon oleaginosum]TXT04623.1 hypothetical protein COLE_07442 [Cutaneotrichosporon oleaginosum]